MTDATQISYASVSAQVPPTAVQSEAPEQLGPDGLAALVSLAALFELEDEKQAEAAYRDAICADPGLVDAYGGLIALLCRQRREDGALDLINLALDRCETVAELHYYRGMALESAGRCASAIEAFGRALTLDRSLAEPHYRLGLLCERLGDPVTSARYLTRYRQLVGATASDNQLN